MVLDTAVVAPDREEVRIQLQSAHEGAIDGEEQGGGRFQVHEGESEEAGEVRNFTGFS